MIDILLLLILAGVTWCVASEGPWGAATTFFSVVFAGLLAMNFFEPVAAAISSSPPWNVRADVIALLGLFALGVTGFRVAIEYLQPTQIEVPPMFYDATRWAMGLLTGYLTMAIVLTALHTAPLPREFLGFRPERSNFLEMSAPDRQWLAFTQHCSERIYSTGNIFDGSVFPVAGQPAQVWSSFPIRYADRRERFASGGAGGGAASGPASSAPPPPPAGATPRGGRSGTQNF
ncbi:MAG: CvpA family protein [Planctomyces sp.]|nr:CvpA family protein [Planctomyces sp.]